MRGARGEINEETNGERNERALGEIIYLLLHNFYEIASPNDASQCERNALPSFRNSKPKRNAELCE